MATRSPTEHHAYWGNTFATYADLPNVAGATIQSATLEDGDTAFIPATDLLYVCTDSTLGAAVWQVVGAQSQSFPQTHPLTHAHSNNTVSLFAALYLPACTLAATSTALVHLRMAGRQAEITLVDLSNVTRATWTSTAAAAPEYQSVPLTSGGVLAGGWYNIGLDSRSGGEVNAHGLYLTV